MGNEFPRGNSVPQCSKSEAQRPNSFSGYNCAKNKLWRGKQLSSFQNSYARSIASKLITPGSIYAEVTEAVNSPVILYRPYFEINGASAQLKQHYQWRGYPHNHIATNNGSKNIRGRKWIFYHPYELCVRARYEKLRTWNCRAHGTHCTYQHTWSLNALLSSERSNKRAAYLNLDRNPDMTRYRRQLDSRNACRWKFRLNIGQWLLSDPPVGPTEHV
jgi:hypothetical protein